MLLHAQWNRCEISAQSIFSDKKTCKIRCKAHVLHSGRPRATVCSFVQFIIRSQTIEWIILTKKYEFPSNFNFFSSSFLCYYYWIYFIFHAICWLFRELTRGSVFFFLKCEFYTIYKQKFISTKISSYFLTVFINHKI